VVDLSADWAIQLTFVDHLLDCGHVILSQRCPQEDVSELLFADLAEVARPPVAI
jgi:hypothetical protein